MASSDALTGLPNRRALEERMASEMSRARRNGSPLCLAIVDIDLFKSYNDANGHLAGDELLRECAMAWDSELRGEDTISRFGGEEFVVVLPECAARTGGPDRRAAKGGDPAWPDGFRRPRGLGPRRVGGGADRPRRWRPLPGQGERPRPPRPGALTRTAAPPPGPQNEQSRARGPGSGSGG